MRDAKPPSSRRLTLLFVVLGGVLTLLPESALERLALAPDAVFSGEWWRLWTGHFVHFSILHAAADLGVILLCGLYMARTWSTRAYATLWLLAPALLSCLLLLTTPGLAEYRGASGLATMFAVISGFTLWHQQPRWRSALLLLGTLFAIKTLLDAFKLPLGIAITDLPSEVQVVWQAHLIGALLGMVWFFGMRRSAARTS